MTPQSSVAPSKETGTDLKLVPTHELLEHTRDLFNKVARRAYEIFERRGRVDGNDREDWLLAESEMLKPVKCHVQSSGDHLIVHAEVPGFRPDQIKVSLEPRWLRIGGSKENSENRNNGESVMYSLGRSALPAEQIFHVAELPATVDPSRAEVTFKEGTLEIVVPKASAPAATRTNEATIQARVASSRS